MNYCARAPGKIILSGEHSVVYGAPAIVAALSCYTTVRFTPLHRTKGIRTLFKGLPRGPIYPLHALHHFKNKLDERFEQFSRGERPVQHILNRPDDLVMYTLASLFQHLPLPGRTSTHHLPMPGRLSSESDLPLGAGMGSSAAAIAATLVLYEHLLERPMSAHERFERVRFCERLQHGKGSAIDAAAVTYGGVQILNEGEAQPLDTSLEDNGYWYWLLQGYPEVSTGECVVHVRAQHGQDSALWQAFTTCSEALREALLTHKNPDEALKENARLLAHIGVVPERAQQLIAQVEANGGSAKISGAGAHRGESGGIILIHHHDSEAIPKLLNGLPYQWGPLHVSTQGAALCSIKE
ncbi:GHMP kinase [Suttonella sp. R2A3]|uniref:mevalonate kinase family protein n=1 Tax=Suttonella sp. R2A3 TaxID=2908648 RepID=UPI001F376558|nr:GHMP kinase [Suttonella sp. R2A3]UJF25420.1 GHMP kinase [Suttonella sp. R2A3]